MKKLLAILALAALVTGCATKAPEKGQETQQQDLLKQAEEEASKSDINDQSKYLVDQKIEVLRSLN